MIAHGRGRFGHVLKEVAEEPITAPSFVLLLLGASEGARRENESAGAGLAEGLSQRGGVTSVETERGSFGCR